MEHYIRGIPLDYYLAIYKLCKSLYLDGPDIMESKSATEGIKSLSTLASILRFGWILGTPPLHPDDVTDGEVRSPSNKIVYYGQLPSKNSP